MALVYRRTDLVLRRGAPAAEALVKALQLDLRKLGYLRSGIDGQFGDGTERAVRALQFDLLHGSSAGDDGAAPVALRTFNRGRVTDLTGIVDERLAGCLEDLLGDPGVTALPRSDDPVAANQQAFASVRRMVGLTAPRSFLLAILLQESGGLHFRVPTPGNPDDYIVVGLDRNDEDHPDHITSRGYGIGQYTLFHHPPRADEVQTLMLDPVGNVRRAVRELTDKLDNFVNGPTPGAQADDRLAEIGRGALRRCRFEASDPRFMNDCVRCAAGSLIDITPETPLHPGTTDTLQPTQYHPETGYSRVPDRAKMGCDWPYAVRRYNGSGVNSYHYQFEVLQRLTRPPVAG
ncbi:MAG TPA: peptidoglycan-binding domain-containing protein [Methylomirabilota bacterium]|jgi:Putative peptidoglycan binding domain|nr:peptidoglycan-binding domain-containing protein [Methylomirabilota bacterium]